MTQPHDWEKEFDTIYFLEMEGGYRERRMRLLYFITSLLKEEKLRLLDELLAEFPPKANPNYGKKWENGLQETHEAVCEGWNNALRTTKSLLEDKRKEIWKYLMKKNY